MHNHNFFGPYRVTLFVLVILSLFYLSPGVALAETPIPSETPTRLVIPGIDLDSQVTPVGRKAVVVEGKVYRQWETADDLVGWHNVSARLGQVGNTVLAGHSDIFAEVFRNLKDINLGDLVIAFANNQPHYYVVTDKVLVQEKDVPIEQRLLNAKWIAGTADERLTMVTCALPGSTHRLIVVAKPLVLAQQGN